MTNQETNVTNAAITTLTSSFGPTDLTASVASTTDFPTSPCYAVIDPDDDTKREIILFDGTFTATTLVTTVIGNRYLSGSAAGSGLTHDSGAKVIISAGLAQLWQDINDRVDEHAHGGGSDGAQVDHGGLGGLADDDHTQYFNSSRHDAHDHSAAAASIASGDLADHNKVTHDALGLDHGSLSGLADDDHTQYFNSTRHDAHDHSTAAGTVSLSDLADLSDGTRTAELQSVDVAGASVDETDAPSTYPTGISTNLAGTGWPVTSGFVTTVKHSASRVLQVFTPASASLSDALEYVRYGYEGGGTDDWGPWRQMGGNRQASGVVSVTHTSQQNKTTAVSFPSGRFDTAANIAVTATVRSGAGNTARMTCRTTNVLTTGFDLLTSANSSITETFNVSWVAMQEPA